MFKWSWSSAPEVGLDSPVLAGQKKGTQGQKVLMSVTAAVSTLVVMQIFDEASHYQGTL